jgi:MFS family permease
MADDDGHRREHERAALVLAVAGGALIPLNSTMLAVGLPTLADDLRVTRGHAALLVTAYLAAMLVCQPIGGRLGDRHGSRKVLGIAIAGFALASVAATVAPTFLAALAGRCAQAVFGAGITPNTQALLRSTVAAERRGRAFGLVGTGIGAGAAIGPILGGALADGVGWRGIFAVNVPLCLLALALLARTTTPPRHPVGEHDAPRPRGVAFGLLRARRFAAACLTQTTGNYALYTVLLVLPLLLAERGWHGAGVGLATAGLTVGMLVLGPIGGTLGDRHGRGVPITIGLTTLVAGCAVLALAADTAAGLVAGPLVMGIGMGLSGASLQAAALEAVPSMVAGSAAGLFSASRYVGSIAGSLAISAAAVEDVPSARPVLLATIAAAVIATAAGRFVAPKPAAYANLEA